MPPGTLARPRRCSSAPFPGAVYSSCKWPARRAARCSWALSSARRQSHACGCSNQIIDSATTLCVPTGQKYTLSGDANLDGAVNTIDFNMLASHFNGTTGLWSDGDFNFDGTSNALDFNALAINFGTGGGGAANRLWFQGDFNYDGRVNTLDFTALASNYNLALASPAIGSMVPEPFVPLLSSLLLMKRRRR